MITDMIPDLPPIKRLFKPDDGFVLVDVDYERADAQFVAWESDESELKRVFQLGTDIHTENAAWLYQKANSLTAGKLGVTQEERHRAKNTIHGIHYGAKPRTTASTAGITVARADAFIEIWFTKFPGIHRWHNRIKHQLQLSRTVYNPWGFRRFYFDRLDNVLPQALAWIAQSGVAVTINKAMLRIDRELPEAQLLLQIHDSLLMQVPAGLCPAIFPVIMEKMRVVVPYKDPLVIPCSLKYSKTSWGEMIRWIPGQEMKDAA
jgi:DNA polymerase-1